MRKGGKHHIGFNQCRALQPISSIELSLWETFGYLWVLMGEMVKVSSDELGNKFPTFKESGRSEKFTQKKVTVCKIHLSEDQHTLGTTPVYWHISRSTCPVKFRSIKSPQWAAAARRMKKSVGGGAVNKYFMKTVWLLLCGIRIFHLASADAFSADKVGVCSARRNRLYYMWYGEEGGLT